MSRLFVLFLLVAVMAAGCDGGGGDGTGPGGKAGQVKAREVAIMYDMEEERRLQAAFDNGGQTWRGSAVDVAHAALIQYGVNVKTSDCSVVEEGDKRAVVAARANDSDIRIHLERLVKPGGIWTATKFEVFEGPGSRDGARTGSR